MPRDFRSFAKENEKVVKDNQTKANEYQDILNKYKNMDNNELMSNLFSEATKLKKEGKLNSESLDTLKSTLSPFLNSEQQDMLSNLVKAINEQK
ncbi:MAG: hypothetical protein IKM43_03590 [Clostridia bacterium]|nr:hypothetical protein [Clostridia bacterium]